MHDPDEMDKANPPDPNEGFTIHHAPLGGWYIADDDGPAACFTDARSLAAWIETRCGEVDRQLEPARPPPLPDMPNVILPTGHPNKRSRFRVFGGGQEADE